MQYVIWVGQESAPWRFLQSTLRSGIFAPVCLAYRWCSCWAAFEGIPVYGSGGFTSYSDEQLTDHRSAIRPMMRTYS